MRQADLSEERGSSSSPTGESTRFEADLECLDFEDEDERLELVDSTGYVALVGDKGFGVEGTLA